MNILKALRGQKKKEKSSAKIKVERRKSERRRNSSSSIGSKEKSPKHRRPSAKLGDSWKLSVIDTKNSEPQSMEEELKRLQVLQSYFILDSRSEEEFDRVTRLASLVFDAPIALVTLVDAGRQWFKSKVGVDAEETSRSVSFCAHVILNKLNVMVVPDATQDFRFKDNPFVTGMLNIRFYAGAALISPEGYKIGTLCIVDPVARPAGLSEKHQQMLHEMAGTVVDALVARRTRLHVTQMEDKMAKMAQACVDAAKTMDAAAAELQSGDTSADTKSNAALQVQAKICSALVRTVFQEEEEIPCKTTRPTTASWQDDVVGHMEGILNPKTNIMTMFNSLHTLLKSFSHDGPVAMEVACGTPVDVLGEDLLVFRSSLNLMMSSIGRSQNGLTLFRISSTSSWMLFECEDTGPLIAEDKLTSVWKNDGTLLAPVRSMVRSMSGAFGTRIGHIIGQAETQEAAPNTVFWFKLPLLETEGEIIADDKLKIRLEPNNVIAGHGNDKVISDPFAEAMLKDGCIDIESMTSKLLAS